jgi:hypothetical protein
MDMRRLAEQSIAPDGSVDERVAEAVLRRLTRAQLKEYLAGLRRQVRAQRVEAAVSGGTPEDAQRALSGAFSGKEIVVTKDDALGGGLTVSSGDDVLDASVRGYLRTTMDRLGKE